MTKNVASLFNHPVFSLTFRPSDTWPLPTQLVGLEFEYERVGGALQAGNQVLRYFNQHNDGSLRDAGLEFSFISPLMGEDVVKALAAIQAESTARGWVVNPRTGLHVHLDVRDMEQSALFRLLQLYALFEHILYKFVGEDRWKNNFCVPWYRSTEQFRTVSVFSSEIKTTSLSDTFSNMSRYYGLNCASLSKFGSLEFRQLQNTHDFNLITNWIKVIMCLKKAACALTFDKDELLLEVSKRGPIPFAREVFGNEILQVLYNRAYTTNPGIFIDDFYSGIELAQELVLSSTRLQLFEGANAFLSPFKGEDPAGITLFNKRIKSTKTPTKEGL